MVVQSLADLTQIEAERRPESLWLITTFGRSLRLAYPDLAKHIETHYRVDVRFSATVGDAEVEIWSARETGGIR